MKIEDRPDRVVTTEGIVTVPGGATAQIDYMIPGTTWRAYETSDSAEGYTVGYGEFWGGDWITAYDDRVEGTIPVYNESNLATAHVCMTVTNTAPAGSVTIPITKILANGAYDPNTSHTYSFTIKLEYINTTEASALNKSYDETKEITVKGGTPTNFNFVLNYIGSDFKADTYLTYSIKENVPDGQESTHDSTVYYATVFVKKNAASATVQYITKDVPKDGQKVTSAAFTNTLLSKLTLKKVVNGGSNLQDKRFNFGFWISNVASEPLQNLKIDFYVNGGYYTTGYTDANGYIAVNGVAPGALVELRGLPLGSVWKFEELTTDGFDVTWTVNGSPGSGNSVTGNIPAGGMEVVCTNTSTYVLPETGGGGTTYYTMAGLVLMFFSIVYLMYRTKARRRGAR